MTNLEAAEEMLSALKDAGRLERVDMARVVTLRSLASAVDEDPHNASLWREYRAAESALRGTDDLDIDTAELLKALSANPGNPTD